MLPKVALVNPPTQLNAAQLSRGDKHIAENLGIGYLSASLRSAGICEVIVIDAYLELLSVADTVRRIISASPTVIGIAVSFHPALQLFGTLVTSIREASEAKIIAGGNHATFTASRLLQEFSGLDAVLIGEAEESICDYVRSVNQGNDLDNIPGVLSRDACGQVRGIGIRKVHDLDRLNFPSRDTLPTVLKLGGVPYISGSRGCYARCKFCTVNELYDGLTNPRWRGRSPASISNEIKLLSEQFGTRKFFFVDDNFIGPGKKGRDRVHAIADSIISLPERIVFAIQTRATDLDADLLEHLREAGLRLVFLGLESGSQRDLDFMQKDTLLAQNRDAVDLLRARNLAGIYGLIMFTPCSAEADFWSNLELMSYVSDFNLAWLPSRLRDLPGSAFHAELREIQTEEGEDGFQFFRIEDPRVSDLQRLLWEVLGSASVGFRSWENLKWQIHMRYETPQALLRRMEQVTQDIQQEGLALIRGLATNVFSAPKGYDPEDIRHFWMPIFDTYGRIVGKKVGELEKQCALFS